MLTAWRIDLFGLKVTDATVLWVVMFGVILVGSAYGFGMFLRDIGIAYRQMTHTGRVRARQQQIAREAEDRRRREKQQHG